MLNESPRSDVVQENHLGGYLGGGIRARGIRNFGNGY
jgi:hypothetical protein